MARFSSYSNLGSVSDAAEELGLSERRIRALIEAGRLPAERVGRSWVVSSRGVDKLGRDPRPPGRPLSAVNSWAVLALLSGSKPGWVRPDVLSRLRRCARDPAWLVSAVRHSEPRAEVLPLWLPEADLPKLDEYRLVRSGLSAGQALSKLDVLRRPREPLNVYASREVADQILQRFAPERDAEDPNVILRIPAVPWVLDHDEEVPLPVNSSDLLDHADARVRRAGEEALRSLSLAG